MRADHPRSAFSLLEVIIATAILAGSAMVLYSLISLGTKYGNRAELGTIAIAQSQSILDEFIAGFANQETNEDVKGVLPSDPPRSYRISITPFDFGGDRAKGDIGSGKLMPTNLYRVTVELYESNGQQSSDASEPLYQLSRLVRRGSSNADSMPLANGSRMGGGAPR